MKISRDSNKTHVRIDYKRFKVTCKICQETGKQKSKSFTSLYALKYHLTTEHNKEDEIETGITRKMILETARAITTALEWNMLVDIPKRRHL
jgi:hypothetical protein